jgi:hypothetical protein
MSSGRQLRLRFAALGFAIAALLFGCLELTNYALVPTAMLVVFVAVCPPCLLSLLFIDAEPHTSGVAFVWLLIGLVNAFLYSAIGAAWAGHRSRLLNQE